MIAKPIPALCRYALYLFALVMASMVAIAHAAPMGPEDALHLLNRSGFGAIPQDVDAFSRLSREQAIDQLLSTNHLSSFTQKPPEFAFISPVGRKQLSEDERKQLMHEEVQKGIQLRAWWAQEMISAPTPAAALNEKMTLFWHNHFVSSLQKVKSAQLMQQQNLMLRRYALGSFKGLLHAISKDPAMIIYLDSASNRKGSPNENFAREVMELFTLGEGHYSEQDVKEAARSFTGWSVDRETGQYLWREQAHDADVKRVLGEVGNFDGDAVLDILLRQPATAEFVVKKMWLEFVSPHANLPANAQAIKKVAVSFRASGYDIKTALRELLRSPEFWAKENRASLLKSPVDLVVGSLRTLEIKVPDALPLVFTMRNLGQDIFAPPNVKGWPGGDDWVNSNTLLARKQFIERLLRNENMQAGAINPEMGGGDVDMMNQSGKPRRAQQLREEFGKGAAKADGEVRGRMMKAINDIRFNAQRWLAQFSDRQAVVTALLPAPPVTPLAADAQGLALVKTLMLDPVYQLK